MKIILSPYSKNLRSDGVPNPKNFPYWREIVVFLVNDGHTIIQIGIKGEEQLVSKCFLDLKIPELVQLHRTADTFFSVDNFFPHFTHYYGKLKGTVIFSQSNPEHFGYEENLNIIKSKTYFRPRQFESWEQATYNKDAFPSAKQVIDVWTQSFNTSKWVH